VRWGSIDVRELLDMTKPKLPEARVIPLEKPIK
jgi:hypothetical protein